ncbi:MAG: hypothetical protein QOF58_5272, partial [Pseudonocardiales bacterium]|nr:hypothetical protein [Pseudonocardiales bacterium]
INGIGGVGKTALALQWAHGVADRYPDGQLYVNLRGFDTRAEPLDPLTVARDFLLALGIPAKDIPSSEDALVAAYRSALAGRRVMLLLDNARDAEQVRPLLPGGPGNLVLITSRNRLSGLVAREGAQPVALDVLDDQAAVDLLTERIGAERVAAEPDAVSRLVERCAGLPLALGIVAARAAFGDTLTALADELEQERLDALDLDDATTGVRAVFSWSLRSVSEAAARVFVLLGLHPGPDFTVAAAASLAALSTAETRRALNELSSSSLVHSCANGRFGQHDLLRDYAAERAAELPAAQRDEASRRMHDHYLHTTHHAWKLIADVTRELVPGPPAVGAVVVGEFTPDRSDQWYEAELQVLLLLVERVEDDLAWRFAVMMNVYVNFRSHVDVAERVLRSGLAAAQRVGDIYPQSRLHRFVGVVMLNRNLLDEAEHHIRRALWFDAQADDVRSLLNVTCGLALILQKQERHEEALEVLLDVHPRSVNHDVPYDVASHLGALGRAYLNLGDLKRAFEHLQQSADVFARMDKFADVDPASTQATLGEICLMLGRHAEAVEHYRNSVRMARQVANRSSLVDLLPGLAKAHIVVGDREGARENLVELLSLCEELGMGNADEARELLISLD